MTNPRRDLKFGSSDPESGPETAKQTTPVQGSATAAEVSKADAAPPGPPAFRRAVSFSEEHHVLQPRGQQHQATGHDQWHDSLLGSKLPDGITAIPVADPDDPSIIVMQVSSKLLPLLLLCC